ncbi:Uncharacterised protein [Citrobacter freundii]|nr:Uncharacterised protein [Citrobacter freundii]
MRQDWRQFCTAGTFNFNASAISRGNTGDDFHQRGFPGAIPSQQRMDFAFAQDKVNTFQHFDARVLLKDRLCPE